MAGGAAVDLRMCQLIGWGPRQNSMTPLLRSILLCHLVNSSLSHAQKFKPPNKQLARCSCTHLPVSDRCRAAL